METLPMQREHWCVFNTKRHWFEFDGLEVKRAERQIMVPQARNIVTFCQASCCPVRGAVFWQHYVVLWPMYLLLNCNWSCSLERFCVGKLCLDWNFIDQSENNYNSTAQRQYLPSACEVLDGLFQSIYTNQWVTLYQGVMLPPTVSSNHPPYFHASCSCLYKLCCLIGYDLLTPPLDYVTGIIFAMQPR